MKKCPCFFIFIFVFFFIIMGNVQASTYLVVGDHAFPPFAFLNNLNQPDGLDIAIIKRIEQKSGLEFKVTLLNWDEAKGMVIDGQADILAGVSHLPQREKYYDFTQAYMQHPIVMVVAKDNFFILNPEDMINRRVAVQMGDVADEYLSASYPTLNLYRYSGQDKGLYALKDGMIDVFVGNYYTCKYYIGRYQLEDKVKIINQPLTTVQYCLAVKKGNRELLLKLNSAISEINNSGEIKTIQDDWFGENYFYQQWIKKNEALLKLVFYIFIIGILIIAALWFYLYHLRKQVKKATVDLKTANDQLVNAYEVTIRAFLVALKHRETDTAQHSLGVNLIAIKIGSQMNLEPKQMSHLNWGTLLHDIGKLAIPDAILLKPGLLTQEEYNHIKEHPKIGYDILHGDEYLKETSEVALYHHERYDGQGYPYGLVKEQIPILARICAVADAFEAMVGDRPYRKGLKWEQAVKELLVNSGSQFDPEVVNAFMQLDHEELKRTLLN